MSELFVCLLQYTSGRTLFLKCEYNYTKFIATAEFNIILQVNLHELTLFY